MKTTPFIVFRTGKRIVVAGKRVIKRLSQKNYYTAGLYSNFSLHLANRRSPAPLIVYQMGKVGSTTILRSLKALNLEMPVYQVHVLTPEGIARLEQKYKQNFSQRGRIATHLAASRFLRKQIDKGSTGKRWQVVTLVREPIARNISSFFQVLDLELSAYDYQIITSMDIDEAARELRRLFFEKLERHESPLRWFDLEMKRVFNLDVYASDFPKSKGYKIYHGEHADVLLLRLEDLNRCASQAFKEFLNIDNFTLIKANIATDKDYHATYRRLLQTISLPDSYLDKMYSSKYVKHFYSDEEIKSFRAKWRKKKIRLEGHFSENRGHPAQKLS